MYVLRPMHLCAKENYPRVRQRLPRQKICRLCIYLCDHETCSKSDYALYMGILGMYKGAHVVKEMLPSRPLVPPPPPPPMSLV